MYNWLQNKHLQSLIASSKALFHVLYPDNCTHCKVELLSDEFHICTFCEAELLQVYVAPMELDFLKDYPCYIPYIFKNNTPIQTIIHHLKYASNPWIGRHLGKRIASTISSHSYPQLLVPVPLTSKKKFLRGYNQSEWICMGIQAHLKIPVELHFLKRVQDTQSQTKLRKSNRQKNVEGAFALSSKLLKPSINHIGLVDDVITTGATLFAIIRVIKQKYPTLQITIFAAALAQK